MASYLVNPSKGHSGIGVITSRTSAPVDRGLRL